MLRMRREVKRGVYLYVLLGCILLLSFQKVPPAREFQIKAVFLFNFTQFTEWPPSKFSSPKSPMIIGVLGADPFGSYLDQTISGESINGHPLTVKRYKTIEEVSDCHVLYIGLTEVAKMESILVKLKGRHILTVSDASNFMKQGGMVRFYTLDDKIQLQVNHEAAKAEGLIISSKLLRLANIYTPAKR